ncbi:hypothetical protein [Bizionia arctica]|uniref:Adhesin domain-containing protein n=1 Tax=Bizionia arctica TaxID=1495645 RepID=A0A917GCW6_9FLAO|nr:hypothetical protein [Bizionia arctica]GGG38405.1 hypothetical protein GCM10010976_07700 [Bizionia arctica]
MKYIKYIVILFFVLQIQAQKTTNKSFSAAGISTLVIDGSSIFKISIETTKTQNISIESFVEGENYEHVVLLAETRDNQLHVSSVYQPLFVAANDKLSVHKLISIELTIRIPEHLDVIITSNIASVFMSGNFNQVTTELINGSFNSKNFQGNLLVNTIHGDIHVASKRAKVQASSKHGTIEQEILTQGDKQIVLNSINGNITVSKIE